MPRKEPLYPHVPKTKTIQFPHTLVKGGLANKGKVYIVREDTGYREEDKEEPVLPKGTPYPALYKEVMAVIDDIGHITYTYFPSVGVGHIEVIDVEPYYQRRGFGSKLLQFAIDDMRKKGITKWLSANAWSEAGEKLLKAFGFIYAGKGTLMVKI